MADNKKYYYLKLKENFYEREEIKIIESLPNGYLYSNILLKLYLKSLKRDGKLMVTDFIPYSVETLSTVLNHNIDTVRSAINIFKEFKLLEVLDNGAIYIHEIQNFIGKSSSEGDRKRESRIKAECEKKQLENGQMSDICLIEENETSKNHTLQSFRGQMSDEPPLEIEIELEKEIEKELELEIKNKLIVDKWNSINLHKLTSIKPGTIRYKQMNARIKEYGQDKFLDAIEQIKYSSFLKGKNDSDWIITFGWLVKPNNFIKVLEGNYRDKEGGGNDNRSNRNYAKNNAKEDKYKGYNFG